MRDNPSNCYYHPDRGTVATCKKCGVGICKECAAKSAQGGVLCYQCANEELKQEHREYRALLKERGGRFVEGRDFVGPGIVGLLFIAAFFVLALVQGDHFLSSMARSIPVPAFVFLMILFSYILFSIPFCYIVLSGLYTQKYHSWFASIYFFIEIVISIFFGWAVFTFIWVRFLVRKSKAKKSNASTPNN